MANKWDTAREGLMKAAQTYAQAAMREGLTEDQAVMRFQKEVVSKATPDTVDTINTLGVVAIRFNYAGSSF